MKKLSLKAITITACTLFSVLSFGSFQYDLDFKAESRVTSSKGATVYTINDEGVLKPADELKQDTKFTFRPGTTFQGTHYLTSSGKKQKVRGRYFGSIVIDEESVPFWQRKKIRELNKQKIFIYEWKVDKKDYIIKAFDEEPTNPEVIPANSTFRWESVNPSRAWTAYAADFIVQNKEVFHDENISDVTDFCPGFKEASDENKTAFWIHLLNSLSKKESAFDPMVANDESNFGDGNLDVVSRGLLQTSVASSRAYKRTGCNVKDATDLHNPKTSLTCGLAIFKRWLTSDNCISCKNAEGKHRGIARYWSPLRARYQVSCSICSGGVANIGFRKVIIEETSKMPACQVSSSAQ